MAEQTTKGRSAPARAAKETTPEERARIRAAVKRRFPNVGEGRAALIRSKMEHP